MYIYIRTCHTECVAVCCSVLQYVAVAPHLKLACELRVTVRNMLQRVAVHDSLLQCVAVCCSVLQCVAVCCNVLQCVAVYYRVL